MGEITFFGDCEICGTRNTAVRVHHLIPQRLLKILPIKMKKRWEYQKVKACNKCNSYIHPENKLYETIIQLKKQLGYNTERDEKHV
jgi:hypothetical protein